MDSNPPVPMRSGAALRPWLVPTVRPTDLARKAGVSPQYVYAVLAGKKRPSAKIVQAAGELGLPVDVIFGEPRPTKGTPAAG